jgi:hypothetical protein
MVQLETLYALGFEEVVIVAGHAVPPTGGVTGGVGGAGGFVGWVF